MALKVSNTPYGGTLAVAAPKKSNSTLSVAAPKPQPSLSVTSNPYKGNVSVSGFPAQYNGTQSSLLYGTGLTLTPPGGSNQQQTQSTSPSTAPSGGSGSSGGGSSAPALPDRSNSIALQLAGLGALGSQESAGISAVDKAYGSLIGQYDTETKSNEKTYTTQSDTNMNNLQKNKQTALINAAQGRQGLFGTLASLGALNGSGIQLANQAVQKGANDDLSGAADNYGTNQSSVDTAIGSYRQEDERRRQEASTASDNAKTNVKGDTLRSRMEFYKTLSNDYADMGNEAQAKKYSTMAGDLYSQVAATNVPNSSIGYTGAAFNPASLQNYISGADSTVVNATPANGAGSLPGLVAAPTKKKENQLV